MNPPLVNVAGHLPLMAERQPDTLAVAVPRGRRNGRIDYVRHSFRELNQATDRTAHALAAAGIQRGDRVAMMVPPSLEFFALTFAFFKLGAVPVFVDPGMGVRNLGECLSEAAPSGFVGVPKAHLARILLRWARKSIRTKIAVGRFPGATPLKKLQAEAPATAFPTVDSQTDETAAILFTSGSTGVPKGAVYTHGIFSAQVDLLRRVYGIQPGEIDLPTFPLFALFAPALGMSSVLPLMDFSRPGRIHPPNAFEAIEQFGCTTMFGSPAVINKLGRHGESGVRLPTLRRVLSAGAPVPAPVLKRFTKLLNPGVEIFTPYGATESLPVCSIGSAEILAETCALTKEGKGICVGRPVPGVTVRIIPISDEPIEEWDESRCLPAGEVGEIVVRGPVVTREYWSRPTATKGAKIRDAATGEVLHRMGDLGWFDDEGRLWFCGRKSHRVETRGRTLFTDQCEPIFNQHPDVARTALVGVRKGADVIPVLCVELESSQSAVDRSKTLRDILELGAKHEHTAEIRTILFHPSLPVDVRHNSKIFREKLAVWAAEKLR